MRRAAATLSLLIAFALAAPAAPRDATGEHGASGGHAPAGMANAVRIDFDAVRPQRLDVVTGESVQWTNDSARVHTVTADDGGFDSGRLTASQTFTRRFGTPGEVPYHCTLHPFIRGAVAVHDLLLDRPAQGGAPKTPFPFSGRTALPGGAAVSIEADRGAGYLPVGSAKVGDDGRFGTRIVPVATASYRAVAGGITSAPVRLLVLDRRISLQVRRVRAQLQLRAKVTPSSRGGRIVLQLYLPERFGWWPVQRAKLGKDSATSFTLNPRQRLRARVRYTLADGATALATSRTVHVGPAGRTSTTRP